MTTTHPKTLHHLTITTVLLTITILQSPTSSIDFTFNSFTPSSNLLFFGNSSLHKSPNLISLTNDSPFTIGRVLYPTRLPTKSPQKPHQTTLPFSTSFIFSIAQLTNFLPGHGLVFIFAPSVGINGTSSAQHLGLFNRTNDGLFDNHVFGVEFDVFKNPEFNDINDNHIGVNLNSLTSFVSQPSGYWRFDEKSDGYFFVDLKLNNGVNYQVWIDYWDSMLSVSIAPAGMKRPSKALIQVSVDLSSVFLDEMYVGFCGATGRLVESHRILAWSFSNTNKLVGDLLVTSNLPNFVPRGGNSSVFRSKGAVAGVTLAVVFVLCCGVGIFVMVLKKRRRRRGKRDVEDVEEWELEYWPHRIVYQSIFEGTNGFAEENVIGFGGNGKVYKGVEGGVEVAVKRFMHKSEEGMREFLAEVSSLGRLKHRNLVGLRGWCKRDKDSLILVYDYLENGSLDKRVFECEESLMLSWEDRIRILKDVANGVLYLHEGWEKRVLHRDIKASNVLLDSEMNGKLGDFGLARMYGHGEGSSTTRVVGTVGYMAAELVRTGRASAQTDVFGFGVLILEVVCGRRPIEDGKPPLVEWLWALIEQDKLVSALDERLKAKGGYDDQEVERILHLGLLCAYPDPNNRPTMRHVVKLFEGQSNVAEDIEGEGFDMHLLDKVKSTAMWSKYHHSSSSGGHPTFKELRQSMSTSMSLSWSDVMVDGR